MVKMKSNNRLDKAMDHLKLYVWLV